MANDVPEGAHIDFEVIAVNGSELLVRFRLNDRHLDISLKWDGRGDVIDTLKQVATLALAQFNTPPTPAFDLLQMQVGKQGHVIIPTPPVPIPAPI